MAVAAEQLPVAAGSCQGNTGQLACPSEAGVCFNTDQVVSFDAFGGWTVSIAQCIKSSAVSFITYGPLMDGACQCTSKVEEVQPGTPLFTDILGTYSADECIGQPFCVFVHDGAFQRGKDGSPLTGVPDSCFSADPQLCAMCSYIVTPTRKQGSCNNGEFCDGPDACSTSGVCEPSRVDPCANAPLPPSADPQCNTVTCDEVNDVCGAMPTSGALCDNGEFCDGPNDVCSSSGVCEAATSAVDPCMNAPLPPGANVQCSTITCNELTDMCDVTAINDGGSCTDGVFCNGPEVCSAGACVLDTTAPTDVCANVVPTADPGCSTIFCDTTTDQCNEVINGGSMCDDGDPCTTGDTCSAAGMCAGTELCPGPCKQCDTTTQPATCKAAGPGVPCINDAASSADCFCDEFGECVICVTDCPGTGVDECNAPNRGCAERQSDPGQATCGSVTCTILCRQLCGGFNDYSSDSCNNAGGCQCSGKESAGIPAAVSVFNPFPTFNGPCCQCLKDKACPGAP
eukprot:jgi/Ulvmu1/2089/UM124_0004.1